MNAPQSPSRAALFALASVTLIWSFNWIVMKQVLQYSGPFTFSALRYGFGTVALFLVLLLRREPLRPPPIAQTALIGLAQTAGFQAFVQWALVDGGAGKSLLFAYTMPFWLVLLAWLLLSDRPSRRQWFGLAGAALGLILVIEPWHRVGSARSTLFAIAGGICWAIGVVLSKRLFQRGGIGTLSLTAWQMLFGSVFLVVLALMVHERAIDWTAWFVGALAYNAVIASGLAWLLWSYVVERLPANVAGLSSLAVPIVGIGLAWALLGERPSPLEGVGIAIICTALAIVNFRRPARAQGRVS